jgi:hypothetical protein
MGLTLIETQCLSRRSVRSVRSTPKGEPRVKLHGRHLRYRRCDSLGHSARSRPVVTVLVVAGATPWCPLWTIL